MRILIFFYQWFIAIPILSVLTLLTALTTIIGCFIGNGDFWGYYPGRIWSRLFCIISFVKVEVRGFENIDRSTSYVFVSNHQSAYDIFLIYGYLGQNFKWLMKSTLRKMPFIGAACASAGHIFVDSSSNKAIKETLNAAASTLKHGISVMVFPEGTRTYTGKLGRFKKGAFQLALDLDLPIVPVTIDGAFNILPRKASLVTPGKMILTVHKPIYPQKDEQRELTILMDEAKETISSSLPDKNR